MEKKYTKGKWHITEMDGALWVAGPKGDDPVICDLVSRLDTYDEETDTYTQQYQEEDYANAALIAAAPELLECLIEWLEMNGIDPFTTNTQGYSKLTVKAINTIKKALQP